MATESIAREIKLISNLIMRYADSNAGRIGSADVTGNNGWIITYMAENEGRDIYQKDLEKAFQVTRSTISKEVNLMVKKGLLERRSVEHDARLRKLLLTPKARALLNLMRVDASHLEEVLRLDISEEELEVLSICLDKIKRNLETL